MSDSNIEEMDLASKSLDELDSILNNSEGKPEEPVKTETNIDSEGKDYTIQTQNDIQDNSSEQTDSEDSTEKPQDEVVTEEEGIEPQYKGKSEDDIRDMHRNATRKISKQNNELYHQKRKIEELEEKFSNFTNSKNKEEKDTDYDSMMNEYEEKDLSVIDARIDRRFSEIEAKKLEKIESLKEAARKEHDDMWDNLSEFNPSLFNEIKDEAVEIMKSDKQNTYEKKGWMKKFIIDRSKGTTKAKPKAKAVIRKKTTTITGGGVSQNSGQTINKSIKEMTPDEYLTHMNSQGVKF